LTEGLADLPAQKQKYDAIVIGGGPMLLIAISTAAIGIMLTHPSLSAVRVIGARQIRSRRQPVSGGYLSSVARLPFVAGLDRFLPDSFGRLYPRWGTPYVSLIAQMLAGILFVFLAQAGRSVKGVYAVLVSMGIITYFITYFIPYLYLFAAMFWLQKEKGGPEVIHMPGGPVLARLVSGLGFVTMLLTIVVSLIPSPEEPNKILAVVKIVGLTGALLVVGWLLYCWGNPPRSALVR
jgi:amino acid transporter